MTDHAITGVVRFQNYFFQNYFCKRSINRSGKPLKKLAVRLRFIAGYGFCTSASGGRVLLIAMVGVCSPSSIWLRLMLWFLSSAQQ